MDVTQLLAVSLHTVAFVIAWGYYGILGRIVLPALERSLDRPTETRTLVALEKRALPLVLLSVVLFVVTGSYLLITSSKYAGLGDFLANTWTSLMLLKHLVVAGLIALAIGVDLLIRRADEATDDATGTAALHRLRLTAEAATVLGAVVVLLTAAAQLST